VDSVKISSILAALIVGMAWGGRAQSNSVPARVAVLSEDSMAAEAGDTLTAAMSKREDVRVFERTEIEKIYREQALSAANQDCLKVGRILGADGLLAASMAATREATNLTVRLIAVKPGVVLEESSFGWPIPDLEAWAEALAGHLGSYVPKLLVLPKDAIPISILNFRSAVPTEEAKETERQLKLLVIERLSREPRFFVLDRERMEALGEEKERDGDESAFWNGSYLLEGTVDRNGYSRSNLTVSARLTPPKGGQAIAFEVGGARTNLAAVVHQVTEKVTGLLKVESAAPAWDAADEAEQFFNEADWALKWGLCRAAQAAADSAWALGKQDKDCAWMRVESRTVELLRTLGRFRMIRDAWDPLDVERATRALELYYDFCRTTNGNVFSEEAGHQGRSWRGEGVECLEAASRALCGGNRAQEAQKLSAEDLGKLRLLTREVADWMAQHCEGSLDGMWICRLKWGCFWDEKPEDTIAHIREMAAGPFLNLPVRDFWLQWGSEVPQRLAGWNEADRRRLPGLWSGFLEDLARSTNVLLRATASALRLADASSVEEEAAALESLAVFLDENQEALVKDGVREHVLHWQIEELIKGKLGASYYVHTSDRARNDLAEKYRMEYAPKVDRFKHRMAFVEQMRCLEGQRPYDFFKFNEIFKDKAYTPEEATELLPFLNGYKSNLVAQVQGATGVERSRLDGGVHAFDFFYIDPAKRALASPPSAASPASKSNVVAVPPRAGVGLAGTNNRGDATNIVEVRRFVEIQAGSGVEGKTLGGAITARRWVEGKLLLEVESYYAPVASRSNGLPQPQAISRRAYAIALLDPETGRCDVIPHPRAPLPVVNWQPGDTSFNTLFHGELFQSDGNGISRYDANSKAWDALGICTDDNYLLFTVAGRLYAASSRLICEIVERGRETRILASTRRYPPVVELDKLNDLGTPMLFEGPRRSLRVLVRGRVYEWDQTDWRPHGELPETSLPEASESGTLFRGGPDRKASMVLQFLSLDKGEPELLLYSPPQPGPGVVGGHGAGPSWAQPAAPRPVWKLPEEFSRGMAGATIHGSDLYVLVSRIRMPPPGPGGPPPSERVMAPPECHYELLCFSREFKTPERWYLKFDETRGCPPTVFGNGQSRVPPDHVVRPWAIGAGNYLCLGMEGGRTPGMLMTNNLTLPGVWLVPFSEFERGLAARRANRDRELASAAATIRQLQAEMLAKYDHNHKGRLDPEEKEEALADPLFIESEIDNIDANHNDRLDPEELAWFDANNNKVVDPNEQAGMAEAQRLLARRLLKRYDANDDGFIDQTEYEQFMGSPQGAIGPRPQVRNLPGATEDGRIEIDKFASMVDGGLRARLRTYRIQEEERTRAQAGGTNGAPDPKQVFKLAVEAYWRDPASVTNAPLFPHRPPPQGKDVPNPVRPPLWNTQ
jgi:TolB-like protein